MSYILPAVVQERKRNDIRTVRRDKLKVDYTRKFFLRLTQPRSLGLSSLPPPTTREAERPWERGSDLQHPTQLFLERALHDDPTNGCVGD